MTKSEKAFENYLDEVITHAGATGKRRHVHAVGWRAIAAQVWSDCMERQHDTGIAKRDQQHGSSSA
ncbi:hypothetical protein [Erwinia sp. E_sp_B04_7]|uniref:hypothetical protein n=1 Tax=unclassified Erwinia TaxID=2622719 RepID=UPI0030D1D6C3